MNGPALLNFTSGAIAFGYVVISLWFFCAWRRAGIGLFAWFAAAFSLLAIERVILAFDEANDEYRPFVYMIRLVAFLIIILGIVLHNRRPGL